MHDRPGCALGQLDDRVANARIDHAVEDKDTGHHRVSRPPRARPTALRLARRAGVSYDLRAAPAWDDLRASAGARSQPVRLLHPWKGSSDSLTARIHAGGGFRRA